MVMNCRRWFRCGDADDGFGAGADGGDVGSADRPVTEPGGGVRC